MALLLDDLFPAQTAVLADLRARVREACRQAGCGAECAGEMVLAVNEACMNIIQHGYGGKGEGQFRLRLLQQDGMLSAQLLDNAKVVGLDDLRPRELDDLRPGGLGVRFMYELTDRVAYLEAPEGYRNLLQLDKRIA